MVLAAGRHPNRPAHIHFIGMAEGHEPVVSHLFVEGDPYIESDVVFGVKESLVRDFDLIDDPAKAAKWGVANPFRYVHNDIVLVPVG